MAKKNEKNQMHNSDVLSCQDSITSHAPRGTSPSRSDIRVQSCVRNTAGAWRVIGARSLHQSVVWSAFIGLLFHPQPLILIENVEDDIRR